MLLYSNWQLISGEGANLEVREMIKQREFTLKKGVIQWEEQK